MLWFILEIILALIALLLVYVWFKPAKFRVERSAVIKAAPEKIHALINDFRQWNGWSPWEEMDPAMKKTFTGPPTGVGAAYAWQGPKSGEGNMLITASDPKSGVSLDLNFTKPMKANNKTDFILTPDSGGTKVNWAMSGENNFMGKLFTTFMNMDKMVGKDFEKGLAKLKALAEA